MIVARARSEIVYQSGVSNGSRRFGFRRKPQSRLGEKHRTARSQAGLASRQKTRSVAPSLFLGRICIGWQRQMKQEIATKTLLSSRLGPRAPECPAWQICPGHEANLSSCSNVCSPAMFGKLFRLARFGQNLAQAGDRNRHGHMAIAASHALRFQQRIINGFLCSVRSGFEQRGERVFA
jgi:hypothetical protein